MVSRRYNNTKDVDMWVNNTLRVSLAFLVKLERERERREDAGGAKNKTLPVGDHVV